MAPEESVFDRSFDESVLPMLNTATNGGTSVNVSHTILIPFCIHLYKLAARTIALQSGAGVLARVILFGGLI